MTAKLSILKYQLILVIGIMITPSLLLSQDRASCGVEGYYQNPARQRSMKDNGTTLYIPVVVHIVYNNEEQNIADTRIHSQLMVINEDFNRKNKDTVNSLPQFKAVAASAQIYFYLKNITRTASIHGTFYNDDLHLSSKGGKDIFEPQNTLNIWVADIATLLGYASSPGTELFKDGVTVNYKYFGKGDGSIAPYSGGRTLTHEIGHWLGLSHPWGEGNCEINDGLLDTPPQDQPVGNCDLTSSSCGNLVMVQNFMNLADDNCMNIFTREQTALMRSTLFNQRPLVFSTDLVITANEIDPEKKISTYPNPVEHGYLTVEMADEKPTKITFINMNGQVSRQFISDGSTITFDLHDDPNGIYIISIQTDQNIYHQKIFLNNK